jgi:hypothetical protein
LNYKSLLHVSATVRIVIFREQQHSNIYNVVMWLVDWKLLNVNITINLFMNNQLMHQSLSVYCFTLLLLHVLANVCHPQGARLYLRSYMPIWVLLDNILKYKNTKFAVSSDYTVLLNLPGFMAEYTSKTCCSLWQEYVDICGYKIH